MSMASRVTRRIALASRPKGAPTPENFRLEEAALGEPSEGQVEVRNLFLSLDPYMRGRMSDAPSYAEPFKVGEALGGATVGRVETSRHPDYSAGDLVLGFGGWQERAVLPAKELRKLPADLQNPSTALGVLGMPGFTGWWGLTKIGQPKAGETVVVAAASGAVGSVVGQVAKQRGAEVVGIAGGAEKCRYVTETLGFDACIDRRAGDFAEQLKAAVPKGIDVYFENVGGAVFDAVLPLLNVHARVPICGLISGYNANGLPDGPDRLGLLMATLLKKRIRMEGFIISDHYGPDYSEFLAEMEPWVRGGKIQFREDVVDGLENAPKAFMGLLEGENFGKLVVRLG
ncbi:NADP-dependent oxidoreductase [Aureimonas sp. AU20]|uniref:NADP-dependent oxidoreductase n=1 Tax=Aureimonas sp. AU20 TaxID=1349819 RepID=UPI003FCE3CC6